MELTTSSCSTRVTCGSWSSLRKSTQHSAFSTQHSAKETGRTMKDFRDLKVWEKAHELTLACYTETMQFPKHEIFGLVSQIRRSSSSIPANIAEGCGRRGNAELHRFLQIGMGSASE